MSALLQRICKLDSTFDWLDPIRQSGSSAGTRGAGRNQHLIVTLATSILCYARSRSANLVQGHLGYFFTACRVKKRCIATMAKLGICVSYESTLRLARCVADAVDKKVKGYIENRQFCVWFWDNLDYMLRTKKATVYKKDHLEHETQPYIYFPHTLFGEQSPSPAYLTEEDFNREAFRRMKAADLIPNLHGYSYTVSVTHGVDILFRRFPGAMRRVMTWELKAEDGSRRKRPTINPIHLISKERTEVFPLATIHLPENKVEDTIGIVEAIHEQIGLSAEKVVELNMVIPCRGDLLTVRVLGSAILQRSESISRASSLAYIEQSTGMFHTGMKLLEHMMKNYCGRYVHPVTVSYSH